MQITFKKRAMRINDRMYQQLFELLKDEFAKENARKLHIASDDKLSGFVREEGKCHCNAKRWVNGNAGYKVVEGWIAEHTEFFFAKHSVVEGPDGRLICVTLDPKNCSHSRTACQGFVVHQKDWAPEAFADLPARLTNYDPPT